MRQPPASKVAPLLNQRRQREGRSRSSAYIPFTPGTCSSQGVDGTGQTIGLVEFDTYQSSDVANYLAMNGLPATLLSNVKTVNVGAGATTGPNQDEVLLDIDNILLQRAWRQSGGLRSSLQRRWSKFSVRV